MLPGVWDSTIKDIFPECLAAWEDSARGNTADWSTASNQHRIEHSVISYEFLPANAAPGKGAEGHGLSSSGRRLSKESLRRMAFPINCLRTR
jgi:hypothetical protein